MFERIELQINGFFNCVVFPTFTENRSELWPMNGCEVRRHVDPQSRSLPACSHEGRRTWRRGVAVERRIRDREVTGSGLGRALRRINYGHVSHTYA